ncbi:BSD domain-containing protein [Psidium guajava]|nr:BSD domain-containing protein [Psidium guajava]
MGQPTPKRPTATPTCRSTRASRARSTSAEGPSSSRGTTTTAQPARASGSTGSMRRRPWRTTPSSPSRLPCGSGRPTTSSPRSRAKDSARRYGPLTA